MTSAIMNPMHAEVKAAVMAADVLNNQDPNCAAWITANREPAAGGEAGAGGGRGARRGGRRGRRGTATE
jgi:5-methyltetrahydrofolate--homocysteine methyltransferase